MNTQNVAKYSVEELPGDSWEVRRTKQIIRAVLKVKASRNLTTSQLATKCGVFLGEEVKVSMLNGIFAGKRRSVSTMEVEMFSSILKVSVSELLYPAGETIEVRPGVFMSSADALVNSMQISFRFGNVDVFNDTRDTTVLDVVTWSHVAEQNAAKAIAHIRTFGAEFPRSRIYLSQLKNAVGRLKSSRDALERFGETSPTTPDLVDWTLDISQETITAEFLLTVVEPLYAGKEISISNYVLGGDHGEHPEAS